MECMELLVVRPSSLKQSLICQVSLNHILMPQLACRWHYCSVAPAAVPVFPTSLELLIGRHGCRPHGQMGHHAPVQAQTETDF